MRVIAMREAVLAVRTALESGHTLHGGHPDFGGTLTAEILIRVGRPGFVLKHHGGTINLSDEHLPSAVELAHAFTRQVGKYRAYMCATRALAAEWPAIAIILNDDARLFWRRVSDRLR
jgi:hypothetical protein